MKLTHLTNSDLRLGLEDLLDKRRPALVLTKVGHTYKPILNAKYDALVALPLDSPTRPLAANLADADRIHDAHGYAIWHTIEAYLQSPITPLATVQAARRVRAVFMTAPLELNASYATEAELAFRRRPLLAASKADLDLFPVTGGETLYHWVERFLDAGDQLNELLSQRTDLDPARGASRALRPTTVGLLTRLRAAIADEMAFDATLPRGLDAMVFGFFDLLASMRAAQGGSGAAEPPADPSATP